MYAIFKVTYEYLGYCTYPYIQIVECYKYLGIWLNTTLTFKTHVAHLTSKLRIKIWFLYRNKSCFSFASQKTIVPL